MKIEHYIEELKKNLDSRLKSIFIYGAKANANNDDEDLKKDVDLIVIVDDLKAQDLKNCSKSTSKWSKKNPVPVFMSTREWFESADVYPMEYADIRENHRIVCGENLIPGIEIRREDLRLRCEQETKNLLMRFRKFYLLNPHKIEEIFIPSVKTAMAIFKTILRLKEIDVPKSPNDVILEIAKLEIAQMSVFAKLLGYKEKKCKICDKEETAQAFIDEIDNVLKYTNNL